MNLLLGHAALYQIKVADALLGGSAAQLDAAAGRHVGQMRCRNLNIALDNVTEAEVCVNVGRSHLAGGYRADNGRRTGNGIAAREYMRGVRHKCVGFSLDLAAHDRCNLLERLCIDGLADSDDDNVARRAEQRLIGIVGTRTTVLAVGTDDLRTCPQSGNAARFIGLNVIGRLQRENLAAFALCFLDPLRVRSYRSRAGGRRTLLRRHRDGLRFGLHPSTRCRRR